jgi:hypothetical protein
MSSVNKSKIKKNTKKKNRLLVLVCCLVAMGFTVAAAALNIPWLCLGSMVCMGVAIVLDD